MFPAFYGTIVRAIDGDSVVVRRDSGDTERVRVGGVDVPSRGKSARAGKELINSWSGRRVHVRPTATYRVHTEIPAIVKDETTGQILGEALLAHGKRLHQFPISAMPLLALALNNHGNGRGT